MTDRPIDCQALPILSRFQEHLACPLTDEEFADRAKALAETCQEIQAEESRAADIKAQLKARLTGLEARRNELSIVVGRREENRDVPVEMRADLDTGQALKVRTDTMKILSSRPLTDNERQQHLPLADENAQSDEATLPLDGAAPPDQHAIAEALGIGDAMVPADPMVVEDPLGDPLAE
jgi:hypothetical protein